MVFRTNIKLGTVAAAVAPVLLGASVNAACEGKG